MTDECISPLRRRMIEDMKVRNFVAKTQSDYIRHVEKLVVFLGRSPDTATREDVRRYGSVIYEDVDAAEFLKHYLR